MTHRFLFLAALSALILVPAFSAVAEDKAEEPAPAAQEEPADLSNNENDPKAIAHRKASEKVYNMMMKVTEKLSKEEKKHFFIANNNHNLIGTVKMVQGDVGNAIQKCGENNPALKEKLDGRYKQWNEAVNPVIKEAEDNLNNMVLAQQYAKPDELRDVFEAMDDTREKAQSRIEKIPVTTPEACEYLHEKLSETEEKMVSLLKATLVMPAQVPDAPETAEEPAAGEESQAEPAIKEDPAKTEEKSPEKAE